MSGPPEVVDMLESELCVEVMLSREVRQKRKMLVSMQRAKIEVKAEKGIGLEVGVKTVSPD